MDQEILLSQEETTEEIVDRHLERTGHVTTTAEASEEEIIVEDGATKHKKLNQQNKKKLFKDKKLEFKIRDDSKLIHKKT